MEQPSTNPSVNDEPHLRSDSFSPDQSEERAAAVLASEAKSADLSVERTVWDEPALSEELTGGVPSTALTYEKWLRSKIDSTSNSRSWLATLPLALISAPLAIVGVFILYFQGKSGFGFMALVVFGPIIEEILKISSALLVVEKRPYLFKSERQIVLICVFSGLVFAFMENLLYLNVYIAHPTPAIVVWRWTVCVLLHSTGTFLSSLGLINVWRDAISNLRRPRLSLMTKYVAAACLLHGTYNFSTIFFDSMFR